jgi:hypothetical protein
MLDVLDSGCAAAKFLGPPLDAMMPEVDRMPVMLLLSLPLTETAELWTPRTDARLYRELMLMRWPTGPSETDERALLRTEYGVASGPVLGGRRGVPGSSG